MALKRYKFQVNTSASCFLCLVEILSVAENNLNRNSFSLQNILQYLSIELCKIKALSTKPIELLNETDVRVNLCNECGKIFQEISKLYKNLEIIQMKLNFNFEVIQKRMNSSFDNSKNLSNTIKMEKITEEVTLRHSTLVTELREEISRKCKRKMPNHHPRVILEKKQFTPQHQHSLKQELLDVNGDHDIELEHLEDSNDADFNLEDEVCKFNSLLFKSESLIEAGQENRLTDSSPSKEEKIARPREAQRKPRVKSAAKIFRIGNGKDPVTKTFSCTKCDKRFKQKFGLIKHYRTIHLHKRFKCQTCNKIYKYESDLGIHKKTCLLNLEKMNRRFDFACDICQKRFDEKTKLTVHRKWVHETVDRYSCDVCDKKFKMSGHLRQHRESVHLGKKYFCRFCKKMYGSMGANWKHEKKCLQNNQVKMVA